MDLPPIGERAISFAFIEGKRCVNFIEPALHEFDCFQYGARPAGSIKCYHGFGERRAFEAFADGPTGGALLALKHKGEKLVGEFGAVAERECFELVPIHDRYL